MKTPADILREHDLHPPSSAPGRYYTICPQCSASRSKAHQKREVLGITITADGVMWGCNHCAWTGGAYYNGKANGYAHSNIVATYDYVDETGALLFQVCRKANKEFPQRRPDGNGEWIWNTKDVRKVLYRLPQLIEAMASERTILIVEGEKDVNNLWKLGLSATCNPGGASEPGKKPKWRDEYSETLRGANIIIIPDNDEAGRAHAKHIASMSHGIAKRVRVLELAKHWPEVSVKSGGDLSDGLDAGHTRQELDALIESALDFDPAAQADGYDAHFESGQPVPDQPDEWPVMDEAAFYGLAGDVVRVISPHSEADPAAILIQYLTAFGNAVGNSPFYQVESDRHRANLFAVLVGASSKARKGTAWGRVSAIMREADATWSADRVKGGLSSGEGLINEVRDPVIKWNSKDNTHETVDPGVKDKRFLAIEPEFAGVLAVAERHGNILSSLLRKAWDGNTLSTITKTNPLKATGAHISAVAHITVDELRARLTRTDIANGFGNRFIFALVKRSKELPFGGNLPDSEIMRLGERTKTALANASIFGRVTLTDAAAEEWRQVYSALSADRPGLLGAVTARAEAQTIRVATLYSLIDGAGSISPAHLEAALALWEYCEASAAHIFGGMVGDPVADEILQALRQAGQAGMTKTDISNLFGRHRSTDRVGAALALLMKSGRARGEMRATGGRPVEVWFAMKGRR